MRPSIRVLLLLAMLGGAGMLGKVVGFEQGRADLSGITFVPCAVPVFASRAASPEELQAEAALKMDLMKLCGHEMVRRRQSKGE